MIFFWSFQVVFLWLQRAKKKKVQVHGYSWKPAGRVSVLAVVCLFSVFCFFSSWKPRCNFYFQLHGCMLCRAMFIQQVGSAWISAAGTATPRHRILNFFIAAALKQTKIKPQHAIVFFLFVASWRRLAREAAGAPPVSSSSSSSSSLAFCFLFSFSFSWFLQLRSLYLGSRASWSRLQNIRVNAFFVCVVGRYDCQCFSSSASWKLFCNSLKSFCFLV